MSVDTKKVKDRRTLRFGSLAEVLADAERVAAADRAGKLRRAGNWSAGQNFTHLAAFMNYPYDGYPPELEKGPPWVFRTLAKMMKHRFLTKPLPSGFKIPKTKDGTVGQENVPADEGLRQLKAAAARLEKGPPAMDNPVFGPLTHQEWINLHLRHCELHLSFLHPD